MDRLIEIMVRLRDPKNGCPWDIEQDFKTIAPCTLEEAYEVVEAIENEDHEHLREELGDLLLQVVFHAQMAAEKGLFTIEDVAASETAKMIERHPHVFGEREANTADDVLRNWESDKEKKRLAEAKGADKPTGTLDGVNTALPAISRALKLQKRAARVGFDWKDPRDIFAKLDEEIGELKAEMTPTPDAERLEEELGDVLFVIVNLARRLDVDPERALRATNRKFETRFRAIEERLAAQGQSVEAASLETMEEIWNDVKKAEKEARARILP